MWTEKDKKAMAVASLVYQGRSQSAIQDALQIPSQAEVSRLLKLAKENEWVCWKLNIPEEVLPEIRAMAYPRLGELTEVLDELARQNNGVRVRHVAIIHTRDAEPKARRMQFGGQAQRYVVPLLQNPKTNVCVVAWGQNVKSAVDAVQRQNGEYSHLLFVPACGEPRGHTDDSITSTKAAERLAFAFNTKNLSLNGVAARIPKRLTSKANVIREFVSGFKDYEKIVSGPDAALDKASVIISGVGDAKSSQSDAWFLETKELEEVDDLHTIAAGNIGGVWLPASTKHQRRIDEINNRWLGIQLRHFDKCARAGDRSGLGVVVVAMEPQKARIIRHAIGRINHLIIDERLADAILDEPS